MSINLDFRLPKIIYSNTTQTNELLDLCIKLNKLLPISDQIKNSADPNAIVTTLYLVNKQLSNLPAERVGNDRIFSEITINTVVLCYKISKLIKSNSVFSSTQFIRNSAAAFKDGSLVSLSAGSLTCKKGQLKQSTVFSRFFKEWLLMIRESKLEKQSIYLQQKLDQNNLKLVIDSKPVNLNLKHEKDASLTQSKSGECAANPLQDPALNSKPLVAKKSPVITHVRPIELNEAVLGFADSRFLVSAQELRAHENMKKEKERLLAHQNRLKEAEDEQVSTCINDMISKLETIEAPKLEDLQDTAEFKQNEEVENDEVDIEDDGVKEEEVDEDPNFLIPAGTAVLSSSTKKFPADDTKAEGHLNSYFEPPFQDYKMPEVILENDCEMNLFLKNQISQLQAHSVSEIDIHFSDEEGSPVVNPLGAQFNIGNTDSSEFSLRDKIRLFQSKEIYESPNKMQNKPEQPLLAQNVSDRVADYETRQEDLRLTTKVSPTKSSQKESKKHVEKWNVFIDEDRATFIVSGLRVQDGNVVEMPNQPANFLKMLAPYVNRADIIKSLLPIKMNQNKQNLVSNTYKFSLKRKK
jgi:hypothetical protein